jgi:hypothetical protein
MTAWAEVAKRIEEDDAAGVVRHFSDLSERQRRALAAEALAHYRRDDLNAVAGLAVLATGSRADVDRLWVGVAAREPEACVEILAARQPSWLQAWVTTLCERDPQFAWPLARGLRLRGLYARDSPAYALAFIGGLGGTAWRERKPIYDLLVADPSLLDGELWRAFQIEGGGDTSFAAHDKYIPAELSWSVALRRLADEGVIDRQRLIDATLDALARGYSAFRAGWFVRFHDELDPTDDERRARLANYLDLVGSPTAQVQSFAVKAVAALERAEPLPEARLIRALRPAVLNPAKSTASHALRLVDAAAARADDEASLAALVAAEALLHEAPDVQARALTIVEQHADADAADPELATALASAAPVVAPSLRSRLATLSGQGAVSQPDFAAPLAASREWPDSILDATVLEVVQPIVPIETTDELAIAVARALEHPEEIDNVERAIDGISRLCRVSHAEAAGIWAPMRKRSDRHLREHNAFNGEGLAADFAGLVAAWLDRKQPPRTDPPLTVMGFLSVRMHALAQRAAGGVERVLLSAPTHSEGWIDPGVLVARLAGESEPVDRADLVLALLRLAPDRRESALTAATNLAGESGAAVRFALGSDREKPGSARELWVAAARARYPGRDAPDAGRAFRKLGAGGMNVVQPSLRVDREESGRYVWHHLMVAPDVPGKPPSLLYPTVVMHAREAKREYAGDWLWWGAHGCGSGAEAEADVRWCATLQPADLDPFFLEGLARIGNNLDWWEAHWEDRSFLEPLLEVRTNLSDVAIRLLTLALAAKEPGIRGLAADAAGHALADGRLAPNALGASLADAWSSPLVTPRRYALALAAASHASSQIRGLVRQAMTFGLRAKPHTDAAQILEHLYEVCHADATGIEDPDARSTLASYTSGKAGRLAKSLLAL